MFRKKARIVASLLIVLIILFIKGCSFTKDSATEQKSFNNFLNNLFVLKVQSDTLSLNYSLADPKNYGIDSTKTTLGEYGIASMNEDLSVSENYHNHLLSFDFTKLSPDQQLTYRILNDYLEENLKLGSSLYYNECLGPTTGIQAQLPILLAEYNFYTRADIDEYLKLLPCVYDYFSDIVEFEKEKSARGLFMNDKVAIRIINQCNAFIEKPKDNFLIKYFNEKIMTFRGLSNSETSYYKAANKAAILNYVIPAYKMLSRELTTLLGTGTNTAGLFYYPQGRDYYECLARVKTGSGRDMEGITNLLENAINSGILKITALSMSDKSLVNKYLSFKAFPITDPQKIITDLKEDIAKDFPDSVPVNCNIKYVPKSLSEYLSPAMYLVPPIDKFTENNIYINGNDAKTLSMIYTTVAHEGYPGHLYQCTYFRNKKPAPIRNLMNFAGYDEGWATYVEMYSYHISGIDDRLADFLEANNIVILCMYARADIGIHYEGWSRAKAINYVTNFIENDEIAGVIYETLLEEPGVYLPYAVGYLEIMELRKKAEHELGDRFVAKDFHKFLLDIGPAQFDIIEEYMDKWIATKKG
jgi:uncharacterized protein (DUF885 family)